MHTEVEDHVSAQTTLEPSVKGIDSHLKAACDAAEQLLSQKSPNLGYSQKATGLATFWFLSLKKESLLFIHHGYLPILRCSCLSYIAISWPFGILDALQVFPLNEAFDAFFDHVDVWQEAGS